MKHTNVLLKMKEFNIEEVEDNKNRENHLNDLQKKLRLVHELSQTPGWAYFVEELRDERRRLFAMLERANDPTILAKVTGTLLAVESFISWPEHVAKELESQASSLIK